MPRRSVVPATVVAIVLAAVVPAVALGAKPVDRFHTHFTDSFEADLCGVAVDADEVVTDTLFVNADGSTKELLSLRQTFTNPLNGKSVIVSARGPIIGDAPVIDETANTISFTTTFKGLPEQIKTAHGSVLLRDAGIISLIDTFDLTTGEFLSEQTIVHGPHPEADSDFTLFCEVVSSALT